MSFAPCLTDDFSQEKRPQKTMENAVGWTQRATRARLSPSTTSTRRALSPLIHRIESPSINPLQCIAATFAYASSQHRITIHLPVAMHRISSQVSLPQPSHRVRIRGDLIRARCRITLPPHRNEASARDKKRQKDRDSEHKLRRKFHNQQRIAWLYSTRPSTSYAKKPGKPITGSHNVSKSFP